LAEVHIVSKCITELKNKLGTLTNERRFSEFSDQQLTSSFTFM